MNTKKISQVRAELDRNKIERSKSAILSAAISISSKPGGWSKLRRENVAAAAGCAESLVSRHFGTMPAFRRTVMRAAIAAEELSVIAQGLANGDKYAQRADRELKSKALATLAV